MRGKCTLVFEYKRVYAEETMRTNIIYEGADQLTYEIRGIVEVAESLQKMGIVIEWENIGDPIAKGETVPQWIKEIFVSVSAGDDRAFAYSPTKGVSETREYLARTRSEEGGVHIGGDDILFFNGLGDAISNVYTYLNTHARVIGPDPAYPTHSSAEAAHAGSPHLSYNLNPKRNWLPDIEDLRNKVRYNPAIAGIIIINPDNPTGMVYPRAILEEIVGIAREYDLFIISDEIYARLAFGEAPFISLAEIIGECPGIALRGLSKEVPWPGSRCGWIEVYNREKDPIFSRYVRTLVDAKMLEVCSTTFPQMTIPKIFEDARYAEHIKSRVQKYAARAAYAFQVFQKVRGILAPKPAGAYYYSVVFEKDRLTAKQTLPVSRDTVREFIEAKVANVSLDKRFVLYLMASTGICVVPLSGFNSDLPGFRFTLLEPDEKKFKKRVNTIAKAIEAYLCS